MVAGSVGLVRQKPGRARSPPRAGQPRRCFDPSAAALAEHDRYPIHEEDNVPENPTHERIARYLKDALGAYLPDMWVTGDVCMYWEPENMKRYAAPDGLVVDAPPPDPMPSVYLKWSAPPALFVAEVGSKSTFLE